MAQDGVLYIHFCVGLSALLVSTNRAMRRPQHVERAADGLHAFFICKSLTKNRSKEAFGSL